jgi:hypothetical protein
MIDHTPEKIYIREYLNPAGEVYTRSTTWYEDATDIENVNYVEYVRPAAIKQFTQEQIDEQMAKCKTELEKKATKFAMGDHITEEQKYALYHGYYMGYLAAIEDAKEELRRRKAVNEHFNLEERIDEDIINIYRIHKLGV